MDQRNQDVLKELISLSYLTCAYEQALMYVAQLKALQTSQVWNTDHYQGLCYEKLGDLSLVSFSPTSDR